MVIIISGKKLGKQETIKQMMHRDKQIKTEISSGRQNEQL